MKWLKNILFEEVEIEEELRKSLERETKKEIVETTKISKIKDETIDDDIATDTKQISELFQKSLPPIHKHIANIYKENELDKNTTSKKRKTKTKEGERVLSREIMYYGIEVIVAVGYRIGGEIGTDFRIWANKIVCDNYRRTGEIKI